MCKTEQKPNETALLRKVVDGLKLELERVKNVVYASKEVLNLEEAAMFLGISKSSLYKDDAQSGHPILQTQQQDGVFREVRTAEMALAESCRLTGADFGGGTCHHV